MEVQGVEAAAQLGAAVVRRAWHGGWRWGQQISCRFTSQCVFCRVSFAQELEDAKVLRCSNACCNATASSKVYGAASPPMGPLRMSLCTWPATARVLRPPAHPHGLYLP
eukprot:CAMPEP_0173259808 /NCGR_PEP_ID=MMETSP1142-20121109/25214_1 /TAXON_ID=483371 /ORGANISM="non described non described, Strain CCMP2298" /LENGTH=108 /DNA_ID=CAMNT_0014194455 /DNA_START=447 /DNA_END=771 /DNA_ORIENTATION=-